MARILYYFHVTHTKEDYWGTRWWSGLPDTRPEIYAEWDTIWGKVQAIIRDHGETKTTKVYQDSFALPEGIHEISKKSPLPLVKAMVDQLKERTSPNFRIVRYLFAHGCYFVSAENLNIHPLLILGSGARVTTSDLNLSKRDEFIGERINSTLQEGEVGLLFLGKDHRVGRFLHPDIQTIDYPETERFLGTKYCY